MLLCISADNNPGISAPVFLLFLPFSLQTPVYLIPPVTHNTIVKPEKFQIKKLFYFPITDIIGRSVIIHENSDDFTLQPAGNSGIKNGCGVICAYK